MFINYSFFCQLADFFTLQRYCTENRKNIFPGRKLRGLRPNFYIYISVGDLYIPTIGLPILAAAE
jgi:hypothetical protein